MQETKDNHILYSSTDLVTFLGCHHATYLDIQNLADKSPIPSKAGASEQLLIQKGLEHEAAYLQLLPTQRYSVVEIPRENFNLEQRAEKTMEALRSGVDVIYQAVLLRHSWRGYADFLIKTNMPSALGAYSYEVLDTKLSKNPEPKHIVQICLYSDLLGELQGVSPREMHLFLGDAQRHSFKVSEFLAYYRRARERFEDYVQNLPATSLAEPCSHCSLCCWADHCSTQWQQENHLSLVANIQRSHIDKLRRAEIYTVKALVEIPSNTHIPDLNPEVFARLRSQGILQTHKAQTGENKYEILSFSSGKGFDRLPRPQEGDLFFDMEGDPLFPNGLEYLFGVYFRQGGEMILKSFWAHDHAEEKESFVQFMGFLADRLGKYPDAYIYHYNHYETTALKRLACRYAVCEEQLDNLLRNQKFVDLYLVVRESIRISEPSYSIKNLETFYMEKRNEAVTNAADSIVVYNQWRMTRQEELLKAIADYNEVDCISTQKLRDWLISLKPIDADCWLLPSSDAELETSPRKDWEVEYEHYQTRLRQNSQPGTIDLYERLLHLLEFHNREAKPQWWSMFERQNKSDDELIEDIECIGGLRLLGEPQPEKRSLVYTYNFPPQEYKLKVGKEAYDVAMAKRAGTITEIEEDKNILRIKRESKKERLPQFLSLGPPGPINSQSLRSAIYRFADSIISNDGHHQCILDLLNRSLPRIKGKRLGEPIIVSANNLQAEALEAVVNLDNSYIFIQGPPGAGKTYLSSLLIVELLRQGKKVGVTSNSHKAIHNLLNGIEEAAARQDFTFIGIKKSSSDRETMYQGRCIKSEGNTDKIPLDANLFAGTAWLFSHERFLNQLDYLFIDEAGQVSLANVVAMATATRNIVLVGDQMQLGQPIQGVHPGDAGLSVLEFLLEEQATIPPERGIFLNNTRRLRPSICEFISRAFYDGRLAAHKSTQERQLSIDLPHLPPEGIILCPVDHDGCSQKSIEEGKIIRDYYHSLLSQGFNDLNGMVRPLNKADILVVAPYNLQVNYLQSILPENARVGTVDKFQGQEAPVVLISMVTSSPEYLPRNIEFLYSRNRLNVALSRAQCLAIIVMNSKLLDISCNGIEQMKLVNTFCWLYEYAQVLK